MDDLIAMRAGLAARAQSCWDRLDDVVDELRELHGVTRDEILARLLEDDVDASEGGISTDATIVVARALGGS